MLLVNGTYRFGLRQSACRNDYCTCCQRAVLTEGFRSFHAIHFYWIPVIPMGFRTEWRCSRCKQDPKGRRPMRRWLAWTGFFSSLLGVAVALLIPNDSIDASGRLGIAGIFGFLALVTGYFLWQGKEPEYHAKRQGVVPLSRDVCPYCGDPTLQQERPRCERCVVEIG